MRDAVCNIVDYCFAYKAAIRAN